MKNGGWSKWWWVQIYLIPRWSLDERRAFYAFSLVFLTIFLFGVLVSHILFSGLHFESYVTLAGSITIALYLAIPNIRGITSEMFSTIIKKGDEAAAKRVGGTVWLSDENPGLWWLDYRFTYRWSHEERWTRNAIFAIAFSIFVTSALFLIPHLTTWFEFSKRTSILITMVMWLPLSFYIGRQFCAWQWPEFVKRADDNAVARYNHRNPSPQD